MATRHLKYMHAGIDLDTGAEYAAAALIAIDDADVTYTLRAIDRDQVRRVRVPRAQAGLLLDLIAMIEDLCRAEQDRQTA